MDAAAPGTIVWINGPFGGGKTQTAHELRRRLPGSVICDPEHLGFGLHRALPPDLRGDFQDLVSWRRGTVEVLDLAARSRTGAVLVPMTVVEPDYFAETVGRLRELGHRVHHVALLADAAVVRRRLRERGLGRVVQALAGDAAALRRESFALAHLDRCLDGLAGPAFATQIRTDDIGIAQVADRVAELAGLSLQPDRSPAAVARLRRGWIGVRHIRL